MTKIDIVSGFLGAGKTTLIKKLVKESFSGEKLVLVENEFGEIGIDGGFLQEAGIQITEMNSGCICCSLVGDFKTALHQVIEAYAPDRIIIEPSGVGKLSDVIKAVKNVDVHDVKLNSFTTVVDAGKCKIYMKNFGEFFNDQVENAGTVIMSHADVVSADKLKMAVELVKEKNPQAVIVTTPITQLDGKALLGAIEREDTLEAELRSLEHDHEHHDHDHEHDHEHEHHHDHDGHCSCGCGEHDHEHHHDHDHEHHHEHEHDHDHNHEHEHHHDHDGHCSCGCGEHDHEHHHHHHADEVFVSWGTETTKKFTKDELNTILDGLCDEKTFGIILRAKGIVEGADGEWIHFDYTPGDIDIRNGTAGIIGRLCVIGSGLNEERTREAFGC